MASWSCSLLQLALFPLQIIPERLIQVLLCNNVVLWPPHTWMNVDYRLKNKFSLSSLAHPGAEEICSQISGPRSSPCPSATLSASPLSPFPHRLWPSISSQWPGHRNIWTCSTHCPSGWRAPLKSEKNLHLFHHCTIRAWTDRGKEWKRTQGIKLWCMTRIQKRTG